MSLNGWHRGVDGSKMPEFYLWFENGIPSMVWLGANPPIIPFSLSLKRVMKENFIANGGVDWANKAVALANEPANQQTSLLLPGLALGGIFIGSLVKSIQTKRIKVAEKLVQGAKL